MHMRSGRGRRACVYDTATHMHRYVWLRPPCAHARLAPMHGCMTLHVYIAACMAACAASAAVGATVLSSLGC